MAAVGPGLVEPVKFPRSIGPGLHCSRAPTLPEVCMSELFDRFGHVAAFVVLWLALYAVGVAVSGWVRRRKGRR